jgi:hypothetical protein
MQGNSQGMVDGRVLNLLAVGRGGDYIVAEVDARF